MMLALLGLLACDDTPEPPPKAHAEMSREELRIACTNADNQACHTLSKQLAAEGDFSQAAEISQQSCQRDEPRGCGEYGRFLIQVASESRESQAEALPHITKACQADLAEFCLIEAGILVTLQGQPAAVSAYERACELHNNSACLDLGEILVLGDPSLRDVSRGSALLERQCASQEPRACIMLGLIHRDSDPPVIDTAYQYLKTACELASNQGCQEAGLLQMDRDPALAIQHFERGCELGDGPSCTNVAIVINTRDAIPLDDEKSARYVKRGCELGEPTACDYHAQYEALANP